MNSEIMQTLTGTTTCVWSNEKDLKSTKPTTVTAVITEANKVYSLFPGTVIYVGTYNNVGSILIAVSNHEVLRYLNVLDIQVWVGTDVEEGQLLGTVKPHKGLKLEYGTTWQGNSNQPIRNGNSLFYKQNPKDILDGLYIPPREEDVVYAYTRPDDTVDFTEEEWEEWGGEEYIEEEEAIPLEASPLWMLNPTWVKYVR